MTRRLPVIAGLLILWGSILPRAVAGATPASSDPQPIPGVHVTVRLTPDCDAAPDDPETRRYLRKYGVCDGGKAKSRRVSPQNLVVGDCGTLSLYVFNSGGGYLQWKANIVSSLGPFVAAHYVGSWSNPNRHASGPVDRPFVGFTSDWLDIFPIYTQTGYVFGQITLARLTTFYGLPCQNAFPVDSYAYVSS